MGDKTKTIALVLAGAIARGAFEAGVIRALANADVKIVRIIASSAGALNGTLLASSVRNRNIRASAELLHALWRDRASWSDVVHVSLRHILARDGLSDQKKLLALLRQYVRPSQPADPVPINLRLVVAPLDGVPVPVAVGPVAATTFEAICDFDTTAFASPEALECVFEAATASAAFPVMFAPVEVAGLGPCIDGGTVNNTPMKWALDGRVGAAVDAIVIVSTSVELRTEPATERGGLGLVGHFAEMLIDERLYRDLREAARINDMLMGLDGLVGNGVLDRSQHAAVMHALGWTGRRTVEIVQIRPTAELRGTPFSGFFHADIREEDLEAGFERGQEVLRGLGWSR